VIYLIYKNEERPCDARDKPISIEPTSILRESGLQLWLVCLNYVPKVPSRTHKTVGQLPTCWEQVQITAALTA